MESVYIETTIVSYLVSDPSRDLVIAGNQEETRQWWSKRSRDFRCVCSAEVVREALQGDPDQVRKRIQVLNGLIEVPVEVEALNLARAFLSTGALAPQCQTDATHLAVATVEECEYLLTWNCRHLANSQILRRLRQEADKHGWEIPEVCTPAQLMGV